MHFLEIIRDAMNDENSRLAVETIRRVTSDKIHDLAETIAENISLEKFPAVLSILERAFTEDRDSGDGVPFRLKCVHEGLAKSKFENGRKFAEIMHEKFESAYFHGRERRVGR
jgi:hypothetical protein